MPSQDISSSLKKGMRIPPPISMIPRDQMIMIGETFYMFPYQYITRKAGNLYHQHDTKFDLFAKQVKYFNDWWTPIIDDIEAAKNKIIKNDTDASLNNLLKILFLH